MRVEAKLTPIGKRSLPKQSIFATREARISRILDSPISGHSVHPFPLTPDKELPVAKIGEHRRELLNALNFGQGKQLCEMAFRLDQLARLKEIDLKL